MKPCFSKVSLVLLLAGISLACTSDEGTEPELRCDSETRADVYTPGMSRMSDEGLFEVTLVESVPGPPAKHDNLWTLDIVDLRSFQALEGAALGVAPFMPDHGHGTSVFAIVSEGDVAGRYLVDRINLWMPGFWDIKLTISDGSVSDTLKFSFCIEG